MTEDTRRRLGTLLDMLTRETRAATFGGPPSVAREVAEAEARRLRREIDDMLDAEVEVER